MASSTSIQTSAISVALRLAEEVDRLKAKERADVASGFVPEHYWQARHDAERKLRIARAVLEAVTE